MLRGKSARFSANQEYAKGVPKVNLPEKIWRRKREKEKSEEGKLPLKAQTEGAKAGTGSSKKENRNQRRPNRKQWTKHREEETDGKTGGKCRVCIRTGTSIFPYPMQTKSDFPGGAGTGKPMEESDIGTPKMPRQSAAFLVRHSRARFGPRTFNGVYRKTARASDRRRL